MVLTFLFNWENLKYKIQCDVDNLSFIIDLDKLMISGTW